MRRSLRIFCFILVLVPAYFAQASTQVDELSDAGCEDLWARLDNFLIQINNNPGSVGTIAISGKFGELRDDLYYENQMRLYFVRRKVPLDRWRIVRTKPVPDRSIQFWLTRPGVLPPNIQPSEWSLVYPKDTKPFIFGRGDPNFEDICLTADEVGLLAEVLKANPRSRTNVVLYVRSQSEFNREKKELMRHLTTDYPIAREQIRVFKRLRSSTGFGDSETGVEFWFVPLSMSE